MRRSALIAALAATTLLLTPLLVEAGRGGGSIGGRSSSSSGSSSSSSRSSSSSSSSSSSRSSSSSSSSSSPSRSTSSSSGSTSYGSSSGTAVVAGGSYYGSSSGGSSDPSSDTWIILLVVACVVGLPIVVVVVLVLRVRKEGTVAEKGDCAFARLSVCYLATEKALQEGLVKLAETAEEASKPSDREREVLFAKQMKAVEKLQELVAAGSPKGTDVALAEMENMGRALDEDVRRNAYVVRQACTLMEQSKDAAVRCFFEQKSRLAENAVGMLLDQAGIDLRARYDEETIRADTEGGVRKKAATEEDADVSEFVVVSIAVAYRPPALAQTAVTDAAGLAAVLAGIKAIGDLEAGRVIGMEVVWDPVSPDEELTSYELDRHYPELVPV